jgi:hypothetical protein
MEVVSASLREIQNELGTDRDRVGLPNDIRRPFGNAGVRQVLVVPHERRHDASVMSLPANTAVTFEQSSNSPCSRRLPLA